MSFEKTNKLDTKAIVDEIENAVYKELKPFGFRKHGRTLHRFVDGDISQVINFQNGCPEKFIYNVLYVNVGIRVPECELRTFAPEENLKKYYREIDCNIRDVLDTRDDKNCQGYGLSGPTQEIIDNVIYGIKNYVLPAFDTLCSRDAILKDPRSFCGLDGLRRHLTLLEQSMIYGRMGNLDEAKRLFNKNYSDVAKNYKAHEGWKLFNYLKAHLSYLEELAQSLNIEIDDKI